MGGLLELAKRDRKQEHDWNVNPITSKCVQIYNNKVCGYNSKRTIQGALMLTMLRVHNEEAWKMTGKRILFLLHKYQARDFAFILNIFNQV